MYLPARSTSHGDLAAISSGGWLATREHRRAARDITRTRLRGAVIAAREVTRIEAVAEVAESALVATAEVSGLEAALVRQTPHAHARLQHIADSGSAAMAGIVLRAGRGL